MKPFRATYTPKEYVDKKANEAHARVVLIVAILTEGGEDSSERAVFIDSDNSLKSAYINRFTDCQMDWGDR